MLAKFAIVIIFFSPDFSQYRDFVGGQFDTLEQCESAKKEALKGLAPNFPDSYVIAQCVKPRPVNAIGI